MNNNSQKEYALVKSKLIDNIVLKNTCIEANVVQGAIDSLLEFITKSLSQGERIEIRGFGSFGVKTVQGHESKNPQTGERVFVNTKQRVFFKPSKDMVWLKSKLD